MINERRDMTASGPPVLHPLTATQRAIWVAQMLDPQSPLYNIGEYLEITGPIDSTRFAEALRQVIATADSLHLKFVPTPDGPRYFVGRDPNWQLPYLDLSNETDPRAAAEAWMHADAMRGVDLASEPLYCFALFRVAQDRFFWYARYHHLCNDGNGVWLIARRLAAIYSGLPAAEGYQLQPYSDLILTEELYRDSTLFRRDQSYWRRQMADCPPPATLCGRQPAPPSSFRRRRTHFPRAVLDGTNPAEASSTARLVTAAAAICLHRLTGNIDLTIGVAVNSRISRELRAICGMASQVLPLRLKVRPQDTIRDVVDAASRQHHAAVRHGRYPAENLRNDLGIPPNAPGFFGITVNVMSFDYRVTFDGHPVREHNVGNWREEDLQIVVYNNLLDADVAFEFVANADHYGDAEIAQYQALFLTVFGRVAAVDQREQVWQLDMLGSATRERLLSQGRAPAEALPGGGIAALFEAQAARSPEAPAVLCGGETLSYGALNRRANRLAHRLIASGVASETLVGVAVERSTETIIALLAILKAGGAYVPLAADLPDARRERLIADAGLRHIVSAEDCRAAAGPDHNPDVAVHPAAAAYVNYTSGSTGQPKGVLVPQQGVVRLVRGANYVTLDATTRLLHLAPLSFDAATFEIWGALLNGGSVAVMPPGLATAQEIGAEITARGVTTLWLTAGLFAQVAEHALGSLGGVRQLLAGGDVLPVAAVRRVKEAHPGLRLVNAYGPTENTTFSCCYEVPAAAAAWEHGVPIGVAISNSRVAVLDAGLEPVPVGVPGELYVSGAGLARGYLNQAAVTAERFVADPYGAPGTRMYRTGDLVRWRGDGALEFIGRADAQVKLRGFRVEPGETEAVLKTHPQVRDAIVMVSGEAAHRQLLGYVLADAAAMADAAAPEAWLGHWQELYEATYGEGGGGGDFDITGWRSSYTGAAIPAAQMRIWVEETLRLLRAEPAARVVEVGCGTGLLLTRLAGGCERYVGVLAVDAVGVADNFFDLGGNSLLLIQVLSRLRQQIHRSVEMTDLFRYPNIRTLAEHLDRLRQDIPPEQYSAGAQQPDAREQVRERMERQKAAMRLAAARRPGFTPKATGGG
jgi:pristinamycin I synthase-3/4